MLLGTAPARNDSVAKPPRLPHEARRLSDGHVDDVEATWDAIAALTKSSSSFLTLSQCRPVELDAEQRELRAIAIHKVSQAHFRALGRRRLTQRF